MSLERIAGSDELCYDVVHSLIVTLARQKILLGKHIRED